MNKTYDNNDRNEMEDTYGAMLERVMIRIGERSPELAELIQQAVDEGKSVQADRPFDGSKRNKIHTYDYRAPLTPEEALEKVVMVLQAHLLEMPMCIASMSTEIAKAKVGGAASVETEDYPLFQQTESKSEMTNDDIQPDAVSVVIDLAHEGKQIKNNQDTFLPLTPLSADEIEQQRQNLARFRSILKGQ
ncbi:hypothetical protein WL30_32120 [Burkholderia ubonensis]|uniref:hypothetical protein n=1 Tax=Burkholderia ubonensis TaxID=101571 RepID=UPI00075C6DEF|nr:hypothetical protein [Burkholderia ubonensis]KVO28914.1 hypothetical protein WJ76_24020 [Burkholderia ubonensis]KWA79433.1 hypothetical protein WL30_32120 [Burkholderia ubonensis]KWB28904.1 hypothetical protein WL31_29110 [Burkholderia ubonensis]